MSDESPKKLPEFAKHSFNLNSIAILHDTLMAAVSFMLALYLRLGSEDWEFARPYLIPGSILVSLSCLLVFLQARFYRGLWRYASLQDVTAISRATTIALAIAYAVLFALTRLDQFPRSVIFIHWALLIALLAVPRMLYRMGKDGSLRTHWVREERIPLLLVGANDDADLFIRETERDRNASYRVVAAVEDNPGYIGRSMHGIRIYGPVAKLPLIVEKLARKGKRPQRLVISDESLQGEALASLFTMADSLGLTLGRLPRVMQLRGRDVEPTVVRPIAVEDLLKRPQHALDSEGLKYFVHNKRVIITGAGGTIGGELSRQVASYGPAALVLLEQSEYALYRIDQEIAALNPDVLRVATLADVRDSAQIEALINEHKPDIVFHAAAIKHVPIAEACPIEAIATNALGTRNVAQACLAHKVPIMVLISTDKAVNPTNVMGATKRLAECYLQALDRESASTRFVAVRFGNVLGSTGSVVPLFQSQLAKGGPLTVTHPDMTRYFMTVREAVELVMQAAVSAKAKTGAWAAGVFVLDMGTPVKISALAEQMIKLSGLTPGKDIEITYTGLRPGEKLYEELFYEDEEVQITDHPAISFAVPAAAAASALQKGLDSLETSCKQRSLNAALQQLQALVPEYKP